MHENNDKYKLTRRNFINLTVGGIAATSLISAPPLSFSTEKPKIKAIAFDGFPIFDPRPIFALVDQMFPDKGAAITNTWRTAQFEYTWLLTTAGKYKDFWEVTENALIFAAKKNDVNLTTDKRRKLMEAYLHLDAWPDVLPALRSLKKMEIRLCFLNNLTVEMLHSGVKNAGLEGYFEYFLSTDLVKAFKPSPVAYQMGVDVLKLKKEEILFAASACWDAIGAKWFGYPTFWVNRQNLPLDELSIMPDGMGKDMTDLVAFVK